MYSHTLTPRLEKIAALINNSQVAADIGTDHAYLPIALISRGKAKHVIASDINPGPLERARSNVSKYNMNEQISLRLGSGLSAIAAGECADTLVIAGMGGLNIMQMLKEGEETVKKAETVIVQPMTKIPELRQYLYDSGFSGIREYLVKESEKLYVIIAFETQKTENKPLSELEKLLGRSLINTQPEHFAEYKELFIKRLKASIDGLRLSTDSQKLSETEKLLSEAEKI
ncbi:MAG TPA: class I SAM-dependent methyltransferase [Candidatus Monoglobus merdigallinarum]|uniref:Class I SAM-dependent methyltransferase n=1 Tax=Candidatus Monoglobus merdigallinarum TaxID=2838698 RepID=A0A9D1PS72_9FIRM|nr:class I SAM-dependent methyltransferase [Candidatus Monoglobus merdigallinarum]